MFSHTKFVFLRHNKSLSLSRVAHNAPILNGKETYPADIYKVLNPSIITFNRGRGFICDRPDPLKPITYVARWQEDFCDLDWAIHRDRNTNRIRTKTRAMTSPTERLHKETLHALGRV